MNGSRGSASNWVQTKEDTVDSFKQFREQFLARYWGVTQERELYNKIKFGQYDNGCKADYFV